MSSAATRTSFVTAGDPEGGCNAKSLVKQQTRDAAARHGTLRCAFFECGCTRGRSRGRAPGKRCSRSSLSSVSGADLAGGAQFDMSGKSTRGSASVGRRRLSYPRLRSRSSSASRPSILSPNSRLKRRLASSAASFSRSACLHLVGWGLAAAVMEGCKNQLSRK